MFHVLHDVMTGIQTMTIDMFDFSKFKEFSESASLVVSKVEAYLENRYAVHLPTNLWQFPISLKLCLQPWCHGFHHIEYILYLAVYEEGRACQKIAQYFAIAKLCNCHPLSLNVSQLKNPHHQILSGLGHALTWGV